jgi:hypothetical protein
MMVLLQQEGLTKKPLCCNLPKRLNKRRKLSDATSRKHYYKNRSFLSSVPVASRGQVSKSLLHQFVL